MKRTDIHLLVDALPEPAYLVDLSGVVAHANEAGIALLGPGIEGQSLTWRLSNLDRSKIDEDPIFVARTKNRVVQRRVLFNGLHGTLQETSLRAVPLHDSANAMVGIMVSLTDLSDDRDSDLDEYRRYFDLSDDFLAVSTRDGRILRVNEGASRLLGWPRENLLGNAGAITMHPDDLERSLRVLGSGVAQHDFVTRMRHQKGDWRLLSWTLRPELSPTFGEVVYLRGVDVSDKLRREEELVTSREQLAEAQDIAHIGTLVRDARSGRLEASLKARELLELPADDSLEQVLFSRLASPDRNRLSAAFDHRHPVASATVQVLVSLPSGSRNFRVWVRPHRSAVGELLRIVGVVQDVSEEAQLAAQLRQAERLAAVGTLAAGVAHEINNPLAFIVANLNTVRRELANAPGAPGVDLHDLRSAIDEASEGAERVRTIVAGLKAFTRVDEMSLSMCDVRQVVASVLDLARVELRHRAELVTRLETAGPVLANEARLGQVFLNLVLNASQAVGDSRAETNHITVSTGVEGRSAVVTITDTGPGILPENVARIFDPFFTTRPGRGTGLGLFMAQGITREFGGEVQLAHTSSKGTTFKVLLPLVETTKVSSEPTLTPPTPAPPGESLRILVVDDEPLILRSLQRMLGKTYQVTLCGSGLEARDLLRSTTFDVVICDLMMPRCSGIDVWSSASPATREIMVFMTGGTFTDDANRFVQEQKPLLLPKPFTAETVNAVVRRIARRTDLQA